MLRTKGDIFHVQFKIRTSLMLCKHEPIDLTKYANKTAGEEARRQLHKNTASNIEQVPEATLHKAPTIQPPTSHHENYPS